jgi:hypothetical protein
VLALVPTSPDFSAFAQGAEVEFVVALATIALVVVVVAVLRIVRPGA